MLTNVGLDIMKPLRINVLKGFYAWLCIHGCLLQMSENMSQLWQLYYRSSLYDAMDSALAVSFTLPSENSRFSSVSVALRRFCSNVAGATAVVPAHFVSHLQFANRNEDLAQQCQKRRLRLRNEDSAPYAAALFPQTSFKGAQYRG